MKNNIIKKSIDGNIHYDLEDMDTFLAKVGESTETYDISKASKSAEVFSSKNKYFITSALAFSLSSICFAAAELPEAEPRILYQDINSVDRSHEEYIKFITSQSVVNHRSKEDFITEIFSFKTLKENWDGYGAIPSENKAAANAINLIYKLKNSTLDKVTSVFPTPNGTVSFVWENTDEERISFEVGSDNYSFYSKFNNLSPSFFEGLVDNENWISELEKEIQKL